QMTVAEKTVLAARGATGVRLSCQILCDHDMTVRVISRLAGSGRPNAGNRPLDTVQPQPVTHVPKRPAGRRLSRRPFLPRLRELPNMLRRIVWLLMALPVVPAVRAGDWPQFRGPAGQGHADEKLVTQWSDTKNVLWKVDVPGSGWSSPVV